MGDKVKFGGLVILSVLVSSCGTAWKIQETPYGGVIGYKNFSSSKKATEAISKLVSCPNNYEFVSDTLHGQTRQITMVQPTTTTTNYNGNVYGSNGTQNFSGTSQQTTTVPVTYNIQDNWRVFEYRCPLTESEPMREVSSIPNQPFDCEKACIDMMVKEELREGVTLEECKKLVCKE